MLRLGIFDEGLTLPVISEDEIMDAERYIEEILPVALKCGNKMLGNNSTYQQDGARPYIHSLSQRWCADHFPYIYSQKSVATEFNLTYVL